MGPLQFGQLFLKRGQGGLEPLTGDRVQSQLYELLELSNLVRKLNALITHSSPRAAGSRPSFRTTTTPKLNACRPLPFLKAG
jgi:hypothetical protein